MALSSLPAEEWRVDHVTIAGSNLDRIRAAFTAATHIPTEYGGRHANHATEMAISSFSDGSYAELMAIQPAADELAVGAHVWQRFLKENVGPCAFALRVSSVADEAKQLRAASVSVSDPVQSGRIRPDGFRLEWSTTDIGLGPRGSLFPFLIQDITLRDKRVYPRGKPTSNTIAGVTKVVVGVSSLDIAIAEYRRAFRLPAPVQFVDADLGARLAWFQDTPFVLAEGIEESSWLAQRVHRYGPAPCAFIFGLKQPLSPPAHSTHWLHSQVSWVTAPDFGWRLGIETTP